MKLISTQVALFSTSLISRPDLVMNKVNDKLGNILDGMPTILNLPPDVPAEIPLAQIQSNNGLYHLNVSRSRVDFILNEVYDVEAKPVDTFKKFKVSIDKYYKSILDSIEVNRIGIIFTLFEPDEQNIKTIYDKYIAKEYPSGATEAMIRTNVQNVSKGYIFNNIHTIQAADLHINNSVYRGILIQIDTNNVVEEKKVLNSEDISNAISIAGRSISNKEVRELI